jgi:hypothetical protein
MACTIIPLNTKVIGRNANLLSATPNMGVVKLVKNIKSKASERTRTTEIGHVADGSYDNIFSVGTMTLNAALSGNPVAKNPMLCCPDLHPQPIASPRNHSASEWTGWGRNLALAPVCQPAPRSCRRSHGAQHRLQRRNTEPVAAPITISISGVASLAWSRCDHWRQKRDTLFDRRVVKYNHW